MSHSFEIEGFSFSSSNPHKVAVIRRRFEEGVYSVQGLMDNTVPSRHAAMLELSSWGMCSLTASYWRARDVRQQMYNDYVDSFPKFSSARVFAKSSGWADIADAVKETTGWTF